MKKRRYFYEEVKRIYDSLPTHCIKVIVEDLNAQIGIEFMLRPTIGQESMHETSNDNGRKIKKFCII